MQLSNLSTDYIKLLPSKLLKLALSLSLERVGDKASPSEISRFTCVLIMSLKETSCLLCIYSEVKSGLFRAQNPCCLKKA